MDFIKQIEARAKENIKTIILPETFDNRVLEAAIKILQEKIAHLVLLGDKETIINQAKELQNHAILQKADFINHKNETLLKELTALLVELRGHKGVDEKTARAMLEDPIYVGAGLVRLKKAHGMVCGACCATSNVLRAAIQIVGVKKSHPLVSTYFIMEVPNCQYGNHGMFIFSDCGMIPNPNSKELAHIALSSADSYRALVGEEPIVGMLSFSTKGSATHPDVTKVVEATQIVKSLEPNLKIDGELQLDAAIVPQVAKSKAPDSTVAGEANVLIFPNLDAGNIGYKLVQRLAKAQAYGPITQGLAHPINDLSRGCNSEDIVGVVAITALQAQLN